MKISPTILPLLALMGVSVVVAQALPHAGKGRARRPIHRHEGPAPHASGRLGDPLPDLTQSQLSAFTDGLGEFESVETADSGLGPIFNNTSCANCHTAPTIGGASAQVVTRFGRNDNGVFDPLAAEGGSLLQSRAINPAVLERIPVDATIVVQRQTTPLFGAGLIEAIRDQDIQALANRHKADGVLGRAAMITDVTTGDERVGRFGWKAQQATLLAFAGDAYLNEMGITSRFFPTENAPNGNQELLAQYDHFADPEDEVDPATGKSDIDKAADFMRFLAPPPPPHITAEVQNGYGMFVRIGCAECHVPTLMTGPNKIRALDRKPVTLFSDLLLHDMGSLNDGIAQADALPTEMKTAPLWGLKFRAPYLHDGRAPTLPVAINDHDGEAVPARDRFNKLPAGQQKQVIDFLNSL
ncbi:MAG: di-heme oxidoredictase family protein [Chthoniobacter sp.]|uniref:di-heme oxidoredictase family protein n=1 Tax=Chthoniobacter sp. TaxID=2510640 RepID=UPI0032A866E9